MPIHFSEEVIDESRQQLGKSCVWTKGLTVRTSTLFLKGVRFLRGTTVWDKGESFFYPNALANKINNNGYWFFACTKQFEKGNFFIKVKVSPFFFFCFQFKNVCVLRAYVSGVFVWKWQIVCGKFPPFFI